MLDTIKALFNGSMFFKLCIDIPILTEPLLQLYFKYNIFTPEGNYRILGTVNVVYYEATHTYILSTKKEKICIA